MDLLSISKKQQFGIEIEYLNSEKNKVEDRLYHAFVNKELNHDWHYDAEDTIEHPFGFDYAGELVSPILHNQIKDLKEIKYACELLQNLRAMTDGQCGGHIHFDYKILDDENQTEVFTKKLVDNLRKLILLQLNYEDVLFRYAAGTDQVIREAAKVFAIPLNQVLTLRDIKKYLYDEVTTKDFSLWIKSWSRNYALNLRRLVDKKNAKTIEIRFPNGTLNEEIWRNNINFFGLVLEYVPKMPFEVKEKLYHNVIVNKQYFHLNCQRLNLVKARELAELVLDEEQDKKTFMKQYRK